MKLSRRTFLRRVAAGGCGAILSSRWPELLVQQAEAQTGNGTKVLFVNLNGGWDGLYVLQPMNSSTYQTLSTLRPTLTLDPATLLSTNGSFGFSPMLPAFKDLYDQGKLAAINSVGYLNMSRSHLDSEVAIARGVLDRLSPSNGGFISRIGHNFAWNNLQAISVTGSDRAFEGSQYRGTQVNSLEQFRFTGDSSQGSSENSYRSDLVYSVAKDATLEVEKANQLTVQESIELAANNSEVVQSALHAVKLSQPYPSTRIGERFQDIEVLFSDQTINVEVGYMRIIGYDTHGNQAVVLNKLLKELNDALAVFVANMKSRNLWSKLIVVVMSEFGRTNRENGSAGTDHGGAFPIVLTGGKVNGGIYGDVTPGDLNDYGWLPMKYSLVEVYRRVLSAMDYDPDAVFEVPSGTPSLAGLLA